MNESVLVANDNIVQFFYPIPDQAVTTIYGLLGEDLMDNRNLGGCVVNFLKPQDESPEQISQRGGVGVGSIEET